MKKTDKKEVKFENALDRLEEIINMLQEGSMSLDESLSFFQEGVGLIKLCQERLDDAETKVTILLKDNDGGTIEVPFENESGR